MKIIFKHIPLILFVQIIVLSGCVMTVSETGETSYALAYGDETFEVDHRQTLTAQDAVLLQQVEKALANAQIESKQYSTGRSVQTPIYSLAVHDGLVLIQGFSQQSESDRIEAIVADTSGVRQVENRLKVVGSERELNALLEDPKRSEKDLLLKELNALDID